MARFYGGVSGNSKTMATRLGSEKSGLSVFANGWDVGARVYLSVNSKGEDFIEIYLTGGSNGGRGGKCLGRFSQKEAEEVLKK